MDSQEHIKELCMNGDILTSALHINHFFCHFCPFGCVNCTFYALLLTFLFNIRFISYSKQYAFC